MAILSRQKNSAGFLFLALISSVLVAKAQPGAVSFCPDGGTHVASVQGLKLTEGVGNRYEAFFTIHCQILIPPSCNSTLYYTTDGSTPTASSTLYTPDSAITVNSNTTICSVAIEAGVSGTSTCKVFTVLPGTLSTQAAAPVFSQDGGAVKVGDKILINTANTGADLYWTAGANYTVILATEPRSYKPLPFSHCVCVSPGANCMFLEVPRER